MKISDILKSEKISLSFEVFPPKTSETYESIKESALEIAKLNPDFMSVTYGAGGGTSKYTLDIAKVIKERHGVPTLAHLTCVNSTKEEVRAYAQELGISVAKRPSTPCLATRLPYGTKISLSVLKLSAMLSI